MQLVEPPVLGRILARDRRAIAQAISTIENGTGGAEAISAALAPHLGKAHVLGITGAPGAGKSTLIHALLGALIARGHRIAVVAVDPSSPVTGGAVLGDRVRMGEHGAHADVFIRSLSSRGHLGGLSRTTARIVDVFDAAGFDIVIVETVGAGQSEVEITALADIRIVVCPPGLGDDVQAIKAGILEIADVLVVNKADLVAADATLRDLKDMLRLRRDKGASVVVLKTVATRGEGVEALVDAIAEHASRAGRGRRLGVTARVEPDAVAAVDRALAVRHGGRFAGDPLEHRVLAEVVRAAAAAVPSGIAVHVLEDERARSEPAASLDAPAVVVIATMSTDVDRAHAGMGAQAVVTAAQARGLACRVRMLDPAADAPCTIPGLPREHTPVVLVGLGEPAGTDRARTDRSAT